MSVPGSRPGVGSLPERARTAAALSWRAHPLATVGSVVIALVSGAAPVLTAWLTKLVIDGLATRQDLGRLLPVTAALAAAGLVLIAAPSLSTYVQGQLRRTLRTLIYDRLFAAVNMHPGLSRFEDPGFHDELRLGTEAGETAPDRLVTSSLAVGQALVTMAGFVATLAVINPPMVAIIIVAALPSVGVQLSLSRRRAAVQARITPNMRRQIFFGSLLTTPEAAKEVRLFGLGDFLRGLMLAELRTVNTAERDLDRSALRHHGLLSLLGTVVAGAGILWAVVSAAGGGISVGDVTVFVAAAAGVQAALGSLVGQWAEAHHALLLFGHYLAVVRDRPDLPIPAAPAPMPALRAGIELRDVWFRYSSDHAWILRGIDLFIPYGRSVALVGLNGAGKSTLVKLLCRMYDPDRGVIRWDGTDLREISPVDLRERIGAVFQDYMSYDLTAGQNIMLGDLAFAGDNGGDRIEAAAAEAGVHGTISALPRGYDTMLSRTFFGDHDQESGVVLSGGQWQRVALARALMRRHRDLLILDEPSSGLDAEAEHAVHMSLRRLRQGRTSVLISHRLGTIRHADLIAVLDDGRIVERGSHDDLIAAGGVYARLFDLQASGYEPAPATPGGDSVRTTTPRTRSSGR
ncbi:ABC transporter ATP-binding protein [Nonomuraea sp. B5E05]|uniref:ABC transporter ATP-binding protein n=1 Tax=Nonomuraea sp. B5E05 TaxID=3153569 RepID=UPI00326077EB